MNRDQFYCIQYIVPILAFLALEMSSTFAQEMEMYTPERRFQLQLYTGYESFAHDNASYTILTGGTLDYSTVGTKITINQREVQYVPTLGIRVGMQEIRDRSNFRHNLYLNLLTDAFIGPIYLIKLGIDYEPEFRRPESPLGAFIGLSAGLSHIWGTIGEVGNNDGDTYFETDPGDIYPEGSTISMRSDVLPYASLSFGARYYFGRYTNVFAIAGYQFSHSADIWHYRIVNPGEEDMSYDFPDSPFPRSPHSISQNGKFFRIGVTIVATED